MKKIVFLWNICHSIGSYGLLPGHRATDCPLFSQQLCPHDAVFKQSALHAVDLYNSEKISRALAKRWPIAFTSLCLFCTLTRFTLSAMVFGRQNTPSMLCLDYNSYHQISYITVISYCVLTLPILQVLDLRGKGRWEGRATKRWLWIIMNFQREKSKRMRQGLIL